MTAFYNEIDPYAAQWLRNLIDAGHIAPGVVDERSIEDIKPKELREFTQCHFFAGIGVWSLALRRAGWSDDKPIWTGSCPCQPFSSAGKGGGFDDERHLWPAFYYLIEQCRPPVVAGEQVASSHVGPWIDLVQTDMEALGYAFGAVAFPSAGFGAPHIRDRSYWVADADSQQRSSRQRTVGAVDETRGRQQGATAAAGLCLTDRMADAESVRREGKSIRASGGLPEIGTTDIGRFGGVADAEHDGRGGSQGNPAKPHSNGPHIGLSDRGHLALEGQSTTSPTNGLWRDADWLGCRDGRWRPVEPGTFPLAHGAPARVGRLRAYGNAINAEAARCFIEAMMNKAANDNTPGAKGAAA